MCKDAQPFKQLQEEDGEERVARHRPPGVVPRGEGAKPVPFAICMSVGLATALVGAPEGVDRRAWDLFAIFLAAIVGIILQPLPPGPIAVIALGLTMVTGTLEVEQALYAYSLSIPWLILAAFFISRGVINTGLGSRLAFAIVSKVGSSSLRLAYALVFADLIVSTSVPSCAARSGGIIAPLAKAIALSCDSKVGDGTERRLGAYLCFVGFQAACTSSAMFVTAVTSNPLAVGLAAEILGIEISWREWAYAACVPGLASTLAMPAVLYLIYPPELTATPDAPAKAREQLRAMGPMCLDEYLMLGTATLTLALWMFGAVLGVSSVAAAFAGVALMLVTGIVTWQQCLAEGAAWDTLVWFGGLISLATYLNEFGLVGWAASHLSSALNVLEPSWQHAFVFLQLTYFYSHYLFASTNAHVAALYAAFLEVSVAMGVPRLLAALSLGFTSSINGCTTHYGIGAGPAFYGAGYVPMADWWRLGFICSFIHLGIWFVVGPIWWKAIGIF